MPQDKAQRIQKLTELRKLTQNIIETKAVAPQATVAEEVAKPAKLSLNASGATNDSSATADSSEINCDEVCDHQPTIELLFPKAIQKSNEHGNFLEIPWTFDSLVEQIPTLKQSAKDFHFWISTADSTPTTAAEFNQLTKSAPNQILFLDIETAGFANCSLFLAGVLYWQDQEFHFKQFLARNYAEEPPLLASLLEFLKQFSWIVTFNGKSFDLPFIKDRFVHYFGRVPEIDLQHLDLLHQVRRVYKGFLPNCRLQTCEQMLLARERWDDIPGSLIPEIYNDFAKSGKCHYLVKVIQHNLIDLATLLQLAVHLAVDAG